LAGANRNEKTIVAFAVAMTSFAALTIVQRKNYGPISAALISASASMIRPRQALTFCAPGIREEETLGML